MTNLFLKKQMITLQELFNFLEKLFPSDGIPDACHNGLQVEGNASIKKIGVAVSASLATIEKAVAAELDALIVHHGLFWKNEKMQLIGPKRDKLAALLAGGVSLFAYHLPLDAHPSVGNNWKAAYDLGWKNLESFGSSHGLPLGVKGTFNPMTIQDFTKQLVDYYGHKATLALGGKQQVESAALISGSGHRYIEQAAEADVDCFITGSFDEPVWHIAHEEHINFLAMGHHATERIGVMALQEQITDHLGIPCEFLDLANPF